MKTITIAGNIGKDAVTRKTQEGESVTGWSVAVETRNGRDKGTMWFDCTLWGKRGEALAQYLTKGSKVSVSGDLGAREHEGKTYLTIRADQVTLMGSRDGGNAGGGNQGAGDQGGGAGGGSGMDDEIPF
jgi:single-strand DNA-binding protein